MEKESASSLIKNSPELKLGRLLPRKFYLRDTQQVARDLLGKILVVRTGRHLDVITAGRIVETEAYIESDPASHSFRGKTPRSAPMFEEGGIAYVYFIYGMYEMLNVVTEPQDVASAVLIRALEPLVGIEHIQRRRKGAARKNWTNGPGRLARAMGIRMKHNRVSLLGPEITLCDDGFVPARILVSPRVGIREATDREWRYMIDAHPDVSRVPQNSFGRRLK